VTNLFHDATPRIFANICGFQKTSKKTANYYRDRLELHPTAWLMCVIALTIFKPFPSGRTNMTETNTNHAEQAINNQLATLEWMIDDAKRNLANAAKELMRRAENAVKETEAMMADKPCTMMWTDFVESDVRVAKEAKAKLNQLFEQQTMLRFFLKPE